MDEETFNEIREFERFILRKFEKRSLKEAMLFSLLFIVDTLSKIRNEDIRYEVQEKYIKGIRNYWDFLEELSAKYK